MDSCSKKRNVFILVIKSKLLFSYSLAGWLGYSEEKIEKLLREFMSQGWRHFKIKVGQDLEDDKRRCNIVRKIIGDERTLVS